MDKPFRKSILYSTLLHAALLLLFYLVYHSFMVVQTPLLMDVTLIGENSLGNSQGAPSIQTGQVQPVEKTNPSAPQKDLTQPAPENADRPEVAVKNVKKKANPSNAPSAAALEKLNSSAPIGMENQKEASTDIKNTQGLGHEGIAGAPEGNANIEGQLAGRTVLRQVNPVYPDWAKKQGIEATVKVQINVLPNGLLKESDIEIVQTSGYRDLDRVVYDAVIQWEFAPLPPDLAQANQSGTVTFTFSLKNQGQ